MPFGEARDLLRVRSSVIVIVPDDLRLKCLRRQVFQCDHRTFALLCQFGVWALLAICRFFRLHTKNAPHTRGSDITPFTFSFRSTHTSLFSTIANMTVSTTSIILSSSKGKGIKRVLSYPKSLHHHVAVTFTETTTTECSSNKDTLLQSSNPRRRYMRRGSRCPSMLRTTLSLPKDLSSLQDSFNLLDNVGPGPANYMIRETSSSSSSPSSCQDNATGSDSWRTRAAVELVTEALSLSTNFDDLDLDTTN